MFLYIFQIVVYQYIFLVFYKIFLKKETFYSINRFYLIISLLLSFLLPLIKFRNPFDNGIFYQKLEPVIIKTNEFQTGFSQSVNIDLTMLIYLVIALFFMLLFIVKILKINNLYKNNPKIKIGKAIRIDVSGLKNAFTFMNWIFIDSGLPQEHRNKLLVHEQIHVKRKHTLDMLFIELLKVALWWNPLIYLYQKEISLIHEFEADNEVIKHFEAKEYFNFMLQQIFHSKNISFISQFYQKSITKTRIIMQKKQKSNKKAMVKYLYILVIALTTSIFFNACQQTEKQDIQNEENSVKHEYKLDSIPYKKTKYNLKNVDIPPVFPDCKETDNEKLKECLSKKIQEFVSKNFNTDLASKLNLKGKRIRILTQFTIDKDGFIKNVKTRSKYKEFEDEAKRVINSLPQMKPAVSGGKNVSVIYTLPIIFKVEEE